MISVDTKKKERIGLYNNAGCDDRPQRCPDQVNVHDFVDKDFGKAVPYGVYDIGANAGCVSLGIDRDTAEFAVNAVRRWRETMGDERYPAADRLMIAADGGGSPKWRRSTSEAVRSTRMELHHQAKTSENPEMKHLFCASRLSPGRRSGGAEAPPAGSEVNPGGLQFGVLVERVKRLVPSVA